MQRNRVVWVVLLAATPCLGLGALSGWTARGVWAGQADSKREAEVTAELFLQSIAEDRFVEACMSVVPSGSLLHPCMDHLERLDRHDLAGLSPKVQVADSQGDDKLRIVLSRDLRPRPPGTFSVAMNFDGSIWRIGVYNEIEIAVR